MKSCEIPLNSAKRKKSIPESCRPDFLFFFSETNGRPDLKSGQEYLIKLSNTVKSYFLLKTCFSGRNRVFLVPHAYEIMRFFFAEHGFEIFVDLASSG